MVTRTNPPVETTRSSGSEDAESTRSGRSRSRSKVDAALTAAYRDYPFIGVDKIDAFVHDPSTGTLVAVGWSNTQMGRQQLQIGMNRLPMAVMSSDLRGLAR